MAVIGRKRQVICITHLAQIAAMADCHYLIEKTAVFSRYQNDDSTAWGRRVGDGTCENPWRSKDYGDGN